MGNFSKKDIIASLVIGEAVFWFIVSITRNIPFEIPVFFLWPIFLPILSLGGVFAAHSIGKKIPIIYQAAKFALVGVLNTLIDLGILNILIFISGSAAGISFTLFKGTSFIGAVINSYFWNKFWTFRKESGEPARTAAQNAASGQAGQNAPIAGGEFLAFMVVSVIGFMINVGIASLVVKFGGSFIPVQAKILANAGAGMAIVASLVWNFIGYKLFVFKK